MHIAVKEKNFIDSKLVCWQVGTEFLVTWVYGDPDFQRRIRNWEDLRMICLNRRDPWLCTGDFNDTSHHREKFGGRRKDLEN